MPQTVQERAQAARDEIVPILNKFEVDIASEPFIDTETGIIKSRVVWADAPKKKVEEPLPATEEKDA